MQLMNPFDATKFDPSQGMAQLPVGRHPVVISSSEIVGTKDNTGGMLVLELTIIDGPAKGQTGAYRLNLYNQSQKAVEIAHRQLSAICHAIGIYQVNDSQQLHNQPFAIEVGLQRDAEAAAKGYTEVKRILDRNGNEPGKPAGAAQPAQATQQPAPAQQAAPAAGGWGGAPGGGAAPAGGGQPAPGGWGAPAGGAPAAAPAGGGAPAGGWGGAPAGGAPAAGGGVPWGQPR
jgi:hypothetical protein